MQTHKKYEIVNDENFGKRLNIHSSVDCEIISAIKDNKIQSILLSCSLGWPAGNIDFINEIKDIKGIGLYDNLIQDLSPLENLKDLEVMYLECPKVKKSCEFDSFNKLRDLRIDWKPCYSSLFKTNKLKTLVINNLSVNDLTDLVFNESLTRLDLIKSRITSIDGIENLINLQALSLYGCSKLLRIDSISELELERLEIKSCKKIETLDPVLSVTSLVEVNMDRCGSFSSDKDVNKLSSLKKFSLGDVYFEDGTLVVLPSLKGVDLWVTNKKHYTHKFDQIDRCFVLKNK